MKKLLQLADPTTAVFCYNDMSAVGALRILSGRGLRVPVDISLVGFDDLAIASYTSPPSTKTADGKDSDADVAQYSLWRRLEIQH